MAKGMAPLYTSAVEEMIEQCRENDMAIRKGWYAKIRGWGFRKRKMGGNLIWRRTEKDVSTLHLQWKISKVQL
jgi:hypothetical protein